MNNENFNLNYNNVNNTNNDQLIQRENIQNNNLNSNSGNNKPKKNIVIIITIIAIVIGCFLIYIKSNSFSSSKIDMNTPILVEKNGKYGYINTKGKFVIKPIYDYASNFVGSYAEVEGKVKVGNKYKDIYQIIDKKGKVKAFSEYSSDIDYISEYNIWIINDELYNSSLKKISGKGVKVDYEKYGYLRWENENKKTAGIMNYKGKITYTYKFKNGEDYLGIDPSEIEESLSQRYCRVTIDNEKYGIINCDNGKVIYDYTDKYISNDDDNIFEIKENDGSYDRISSLYIQDDKITYQSEKNSIELTYYSTGYIFIDDEDSDDYSYYDTKLNKIVETRPTSSNDEESTNEWEKYTGITKSSCDTGYGLIKNKEKIISCEWPYIEYFNIPLYKYLKSQGKDYVIGEKDNKTYLINLKNGKVVEEFNTSNIYGDDDISIFIYYNENNTNKQVIYNLLNGKKMKVDENDDVDTYKNYFTVTKKNKKTNYYNNNFKLIYTEK